MELPLEAVPNFSEGRDRATIDALAEALGEHAELLDVHADADHHRSVFTLVGTEDGARRRPARRDACAKERIDLRRHEGAHPRIGAADVVPLVPLRPEDMPRAQTRETIAGRVGEELELPVFLYGALGGASGRRIFRRGGPEELQRRMTSGEVEPGLRARAARSRRGRRARRCPGPLIAFNVNLRSADVEVARPSRRRSAKPTAASRESARSVSTCRAAVSSR